MSRDQDVGMENAGEVIGGLNAARAELGQDGVIMDQGPQNGERTGLSPAPGQGYGLANPAAHAEVLGAADL